MATTYSTGLGIALQGTGDNPGSWGTINNTNLGTIIEAAIAGTASVTVTTADVTLTNTQGAANEARNAILNVTGAMTAARSIIVPAASRKYLVKNGTSGGFALTVKTAAGTGIVVPAGGYGHLYCDGTNVLDAMTSVALTTPNLGTPSAGVLTNCTGYSGAQVTGTVAIAATVTTNANLTGQVTSVGNATTIASLPAISGAALTSLTAANIAAGTAGINISGTANTVSHALGIGQSRAYSVPVANTPYTNSSGYPIYVTYSAILAAGAALNLQVQGTTVQISSVVGTAAVSMIVLAGETYQVVATGSFTPQCATTIS